MQSAHPIREKALHEVFEIGVVLKGINATLELALGSVLLFSTGLNDVLLALIKNELIDDPNDFFARHANQFSHYLSPEFQWYGALYLLSHGVVKIVLVWGLLRRKLWAYPASLAVLSLFILYQVIKIAQNHSIPLGLLTLFDLVLIWLIWHEYKRVKGAIPDTLS